MIFRILQAVLLAHKYGAPFLVVYNMVDHSGIFIDIFDSDSIHLRIYGSV